MAANAPSPRIQLRVLVLFFFVGAAPLILMHMALVGGAESRFRTTVGTYFSHRCDQLQQNLVDHVETLVVEIENLAALPTLLEAVQRADANPPREATFEREIQQIEAQWAELTPEDSKLLQAILEDPAASLMRDLNRVATRFREILLTDRYGRLVAATGKPSDYFQADEEWWRVAFLEGQGQRYLSDIQYDESAGVYSLDIALPMRSEEGGEVLGIVKAIVDSHSVLRLVDNLLFGETATAIILRDDGTLATSPGSDEIYPFAGEVRAAMARGQRWLEVPEEKPRLFLGLPAKKVSDVLPELPWTVVIEAERDEVFEPFRNLRTSFAYVVGLGLGLVVLLALIFSWILSKPIIEVDPHLDRV
ncbi:MAG: hypothetical protein Kow00109_25220 [Acidobacteriota bacterium]